MAKTINTELLLKSRKEKGAYGMSALQFIKTATKKQLAEQFSVIGIVKSCSSYFLFVFIQYICLHWFHKIRFWIVIFSFPGIQKFLEAIIIVDVILKQGALNIANHLQRISRFSIITDLKSTTLGTSKVSK